MKVWVFYQRDLSKIWVVEYKPKTNLERNCYVLSKGKYTGFDAGTLAFQFLNSKFMTKTSLSLLELEL